MEKFKLKNGDLSQYALACGYVQKKVLMTGARVELYMEHATYHVKKHLPGSTRVWEVHAALTPARAAFLNLCQ